jgi:hypothetical protein
MVILLKPGKSAVKNLQHRLRRLERQLNQAFEHRLCTMPQAEFYALVGLPPQPTREQIDAVIAEMEADLARAAPDYGLGSAR